VVEDHDETAVRRHSVNGRQALVKESVKSNPNQRHVVHHPDGGWAVVKPRAERVSSRHDTQAQAQTRSKEILSHDGGGESVTHRRDGSVRQSDAVQPVQVDWSLLSTQGHALFYIALCPDSKVKDIARAIGRTERQAWSIVRDLTSRDMIRLRKNGRRHHFSVNFEATFSHPTIEELTLRSAMKGAVEQVRSETPDICEILAAE